MLRLVFNTSSKVGDDADADGVAAGDAALLPELPLLQPDKIISAIAAQKRIFLYIMCICLLF
jgi:hypothetical protein